MYLSYVDDSGSTGTKLDDTQSPFQVIGGPVIREQTYAALDLALSASIEGIVPEESYDSFEYHTCDLFHANPPFDKLGIEKCHSLLDDALSLIHKLRIPIIYGAVDKVKLSLQIYESANPVDVAFHLYLKSLDKWFESNADHPIDFPFGFIIADQSRKDVQNRIEKVFRKVVKPGTHGAAWNNGIGLHIFDEVYFANSKTSLGVQIADIVVYFISRHLAKKLDSEGFYNKIADLVFESKVYPE